MKWTKVDRYTREILQGRCEWHVVGYISGNFKIIPSESKWVLKCNGKEVARFNTLKEAKQRAEDISPLAEFI